MKRFLFLIATVAMLAMNVNANLTFDFGKLTFWVCDDGKSVYLQKLVSGETISGDLYIPQIVNDGDKDYTVVGISSSAFYKQTGLTSVFIPNTVKYIHRTAFFGCTSLSSVTLPTNLEYLGDAVFDNTAWFNNQPDGLVYAGNTLIVYKKPKNMPANTNIVVKDGTTHIAHKAFSECTNLTNVHIPNSVTSIGNYAFSQCTGLTSVTIPNTVKNLGAGLFSGCTGLTSVTLPNTLTAIPVALFSGCKALTSVTIPSTVETIFANAFYGCTSLTSVTIPNKVKAIGNSAFAYCTNLAQISVPNSVRTIEQDAFNNTAWLNNQPDGIVYAGSIAYTYKGTASGTLTIKDGTTAIAGYAFKDCSGITILRLPSSLQYIGNYSFDGCTSLTFLNLPSNLKAIGDGAFRNCTNLTEITFPNSLISVGHNANSAFSNTQWYTDQPDGVIYAGPVALGYKGSYPDDRTVTIKEGTKAIAAYAFYSNSGLQKIIFPSTLTRIGESALKSSYVTEVSIPQSVTAMAFAALSHCYKLKRIDAYVDPANVALGDDALIIGMPELDDYYDRIGYGVCFYSTNTSNPMDDIVLHVLPGKENSFSNALSWARFKNIVGDLGESGGIPGDLTGDGCVDIADVNAVINMMLGKATQTAAGDVTGDGNVDIADVNAVINIMLGK